jgi:hypothetical protein
MSSPCVVGFLNQGTSFLSALKRKGEDPAEPRLTCEVVAGSR